VKDILPKSLKKQMDKVAKEHNYVIHYKGQRNIQVNQMGKPQKATESNYIF